MNQPFRVCQYKGHEQNKVIFFCINPDCLADRLFCSVCLLDNHHQHGNKDDNKHILNNERLANQIQLRIEQIIQKKLDQQKGNNRYVQGQILIIQRIQKIMKNLLNLVEDLQDSSIQDSQIMNLQKQLNCLKQSSYYQIDNQFLREMVCMDFSQQRLAQMTQITKQWETLSNIIQEAIQLSNKQMQQKQQQQIEDLKYCKYEISQIDSFFDTCFYAAAISNDLKYIISGGSDSFYKVWDNSNYELILQYQLDSRISYAKFTEDSQFCYVGLRNGILYQLDVLNNFHQSYSQKIHKENILNLYCITNTVLLTSSADGTIIKTDISNKQQLFLINAHNDRIFGLELLVVLIKVKQNFGIKILNYLLQNIITPQLNKFYLLFAKINQQAYIVRKPQFGKLILKKRTWL